MDHLNYFSIENFKAFEEKYEFDFKPITFLIGKNSSGKSSLTKAIRLCQSLSIVGEKKDYKFNIGDFDALKNIKSGKDEIKLGLPFFLDGIQEPMVLTIILKAGKDSGYYIYECNINLKSDGHLIYKSIDSGEIMNDMDHFKYEVDWQRLYKEYLKSKDELINTYNQYSYILRKLGIKEMLFPKIELLVKDSIYKEFEDDYQEFLRLNDISNLFSEINKNLSGTKPFFSFFPIPNFIIEGNTIGGINNSVHVDFKWNLDKTNLSKSDKKVYMRNLVSLHTKNLFLNYHFITKENSDYYKNEVDEIEKYEKEAINLLIDENTSGNSYHHLALSHYNQNPSSIDYFKNNEFLEISESSFEKLNNSYYEKLITEVKDNIKSMFDGLENVDISIDYSNLFYFNLMKMEMLENGYNRIKPILTSIEYIPTYRLMPERFINYSDQEKSFFHNFIISLKNQNWIEYQRDALEWIKKFEIADTFEIKDIKEVGIKIVSLIKNGITVNLSDVGYGHLQILPLILKCCIEKPKILIIEEPEANLHPALQSKLADFFVFCNVKYGTQFIIETHSEYLIRKMQSLIAKNEIRNDQSIIYYFHSDEDIKKPEDKIKRIEFETNGILSSNFGPGFFDEADKLSLELLILNNGQQN